MLPTILLVGLNHTTAPIHIREHALPFVCARDDVSRSVCATLDPTLLSESLVLTTCNRTEIYAVSTHVTRALETLRDAFAVERGFSAPAQEYLYQATDRAAMEHLFAVTCGIDSLVLGEFEILGQVRRAYQEASAQQTVGPLLHQLFQAAMHAGKRARAETDIGRGAQSVAYAAVALARQKLGTLNGCRVLILGAGEMGRRAAENLAEDGDCAVTVTTRTYKHALALAEHVHGHATPFEELETALAQADLVIGATRAPHLILYADRIARAMQTRPAQPLLLIDIAVPRNIDPAAINIPHVQLYNIDDLQQVVEQTRAARWQALGQVRAILAQEVETFWQWYLARRAAPLIGALYTRAEAIRQAELAKTLRRLNHLELGEREQNIIAALSAGLVSKLLAAPTANLKAHLQDGDGQPYLDALRELFDLQVETGEQVS
ncbi:MAG: glutamyl-tRNA reductase [Chloroflexi bacterium]|nr:glutamyl-tRNA reductase [Chloroflexota bacterium]